MQTERSAFFCGKSNPLACKAVSTFVFLRPAYSPYTGRNHSNTRKHSRLPIVVHVFSLHLHGVGSRSAVHCHGRITNYKLNAAVLKLIDANRNHAKTWNLESALWRFPKYIF